MQIFKDPAPRFNLFLVENGIFEPVLLCIDFDFECICIDNAKEGLPFSL